MKISHPSIEPLEDRIAPATLIVTSSADNGPGTLRAALATADATPSTVDTIIFKLPAVMNGPSQILLTTGQLQSLGNVNIVGPGSSKLTIDAQQNSRVFDFNDATSTKDSPVSLSGLTIQNGNITSSNGAGIYSTESLTLKSVVVSGSTITNSSGYYFGGGVAVYGNATAKTNVSVTSSTISGNAAPFGAGIAISHAHSVIIKNSAVAGNRAFLAGGISIDNTQGGASTVSACLIEDNTASLAAGGMAIALNGKVLISGTRFLDNNGGQSGGALSLFGNQSQGSALVSGSTFIANTAAHTGGAVVIQNGQAVTMSKCLLSGNKTTSVPSGNSPTAGGGAIYVKGYGSGPYLALKLSSTIISGNSTAVSGGGISALNGVALALTGCSLNNNQAAIYGGGILTSGAGAARATLTLSGGLISGNQVASSSTTARDGGGIAATGDGAISITGTSISGNTAAASGGGIYVLGNSEPTLVPVTVTGARISSNLAGDAGGGLSAAGGVSLGIVSTTISGNVSTSSTGGGLFAGGDGAGKVNTTISRSIFTANRAAQDGGGLDFFGDSATFSITGSTLSGNVTAIGGGGISINDGNPGAVKITATKLAGNIAVRGGGAIALYNAAGFNISGGSITGNTTPGQGGGIYLFDCTTGSILGTTVSGNAALIGGGIANDVTTGTSSITVQAAKVTGNTTPHDPDFFDSGGALSTFNFV